MFKYLCQSTFFLLVATALIFPSEGNRGFLNPKAIAFLLFIPFFWLWLLSERKVKESEFIPLTGLALLLFGVSTWIGISLCRGGNHYPSLLDQTKIILITFLPFFGGLIMANRGLFTFSTFVKTLIFSNAFYSLLKLFFLILLFLKIISLKTLLEVTGIRLMSMNVADSFERLLTSCDLFTPFLLFFVMARRLFGIALAKVFVWIYIPLSLFSIVIGFSRVFLAIGLVAIFLGLILEARKKIIIAFYLCCLALSSVILVLGPQKIVNIIEMRFASSDNTASDDTRKDQISALLIEMEKYPIVGLGMGGYSEKVVRDLDIRHLYEVQWMSLVAQFGWVGIFPLFASIFTLFFSFFLPPFSFSRIFLFVLYLGWLASGFTNPFVLSLASGVMYTLFTLGLHETRHLYPTREIAYKTSL